jgi:hypothetical protein
MKQKRGIAAKGPKSIATSPERADEVIRREREEGWRLVSRTPMLESEVLRFMK